MIRVSTDVFCDICNNWIHGMVSDEPRRRDARQIAKDFGFITKRENGKLIDICPDCQEKESAA